MTISSDFAAVATRENSRLALAFDGRAELSFAELDDAATRLAAALTGSGLAPGDRVAVLMHNRPEYLIAYLGIARAGLVIVPVNRRAAPAEVVRILADAGARVLASEGGYADVLSRVRADLPDVRVVAVGAPPNTVTDYAEFVAACDPARYSPPDVDENAVGAIHYTSGTTGTPRGVVRTHSANIAVATGTLEAVPVRPGDVWFNTLPMHSVGVYAFVVAPLLRAGTVVLTENVDAELTLDLVAKHGVTMLHAVPTVWEMLMRGNDAGAGNRLSSVRYAFWGGSPLPRGTAERLESWMRTPALGCYGATEAPCITYSTPEIYASGRFDSSGPLRGGMVARIVDENGDDLEPGRMGEVLLRGPALMTGYFNKPEMTAAAVDANGWYHTGDWGRIDPDGALTVTDRKKDMIISGGENVYPGEVENVISSVPGVSEAAVVGVPDDLWGQTVWAFVVQDGRATVDENAVVRACRSQLAAFKTPRRVVFCEALPTNTTGKVVKGELVDRARALLAGAGGAR